MLMCTYMECKLHTSLSLTGPPGASVGGAHYVHWGNSTCPDTEGTVMLYSGVAAATHFNDQGGGSNYLCLHEEPEFLDTTPGIQEFRARVYGTEYETINSPFESLHNHNVPCSACHTSARGDVIMIPGKVNCPDSWTREYYGYLMAEYNHV